MAELKQEITEERFNELLAIPRRDRSEHLRAEFKAPESFVMGYGYYGSSLRCEGNRYFIVHDIGGSCD